MLLFLLCTKLSFIFTIVTRWSVPASAVRSDLESFLSLLTYLISCNFFWNKPRNFMFVLMLKLHACHHHVPHFFTIVVRSITYCFFPRYYYSFQLSSLPIFALKSPVRTNMSCFLTFHTSLLAVHKTHLYPSLAFLALVRKYLRL